MSQNKSDDKDLILDAFHNTASQVSKLTRQVIKAVPPSFGVPGGPLTKQMQSMQRWANKVKKGPSSWSNRDFLRYVKQQLHLHQVGLADVNNFYAENIIGEIHDKMAEAIPEKMSSGILRDYLEWWISLRGGRYAGSSIYMNKLLDENMIRKFVNRFQDNDFYEQISRDASPVLVQPRLNYEMLYNRAGAKLLLLNVGIVKTYAWLETRQVSSILKEIQDSMALLSAEMLCNVMRITISSKYKREEEIDFLFIAKPYLEKHGIEEFNSIDIEDYFKG